MKNLFNVLGVVVLIIGVSTKVYSQQSTEQDTTKTEVLDEVLVNAVRVKPDAPITHSNLTKTEIAKRNLGQDVPQLLNFLPSVVTTSDAGAGIGYTGIRVRGINAQSTNVTINGIPYNDAESMGTFWVNLGDIASSVQNIQLQRGVGTSTNGSGAFGASINVLTDAVSNEPYAEISNSFGSFNTRKHTVKMSTGLINRHFEVSGRLSQIKSDGYIDRASSDLKSYFLQASYVDDNTLIKAITFAGKEVTYQSWYGFDPVSIEYAGFNPNIDENRRFNIAGIQFDDEGNFEGYYDKQVDNYGQDHYQLHWNQRYNQNWSTNFAFNYTYGRGYFEEYVDDYLYQNIYFSGDSTYDFLGLDPIIVNGQEINSTDYIRRRWLDNDFYVFNGAINYKDDNLQVVGGGSYSLYKGDHFGEIIWARYAPTVEEGDHYYDGYGEKTDTNIFGKATYNLNRQWQFYGDLQVRFVDYTTTGQNSDREPFLTDKQYTFFNPKAGLTYKMNDQNSLYLSYARANREPNRDDFQNNPNVKPEQLNDFELGWRYDSERFRLHSNLYYMHYNEQLVLTGMLDDVGNPIRENSGESYRLGIEIEAAWNITKGLNLKPNIAISSNKNKEFVASLDGELVNLGKTSISYSPNVVFGNALEYSPVENLQLVLLSKYVGEQYMGNTDANFSKLDAYFVNDLNVNYTIKSRSIFKEIVLTALVNNILNEKYISNGYYYTYDDDFSVPGVVTTVEGAGYYPQAQRNFLLGVTLRF